MLPILNQLKNKYFDKGHKSKFKIAEGELCVIILITLCSPLVNVADLRQSSTSKKAIADQEKCQVRLYIHCIFFHVLCLIHSWKILQMLACLCTWTHAIAVMVCLCLKYTQGAETILIVTLVVSVFSIWWSSKASADNFNAP